MSLRKWLIGNKYFQSIFDRMHRIAINGMNYSQGGQAEASGERYVIDQLKQKYIKSETPVLFDVGANFGEYTNDLLEVFKGDEQIYVIEPAYNAFFMLNKHFAENPRIHLVNKAFGNENTKLKLFFGDVGSGVSTASFVNEEMQTAADNFEEVDVVRLDQFCSEEGIDYIDFLKIDAEGFDYAVLEGAGDMIANNNIGIIQFEFSKANIDSKVFLKNYFDLLPQYNIYRLLSNGLYHIKEYNSRYEVFLTHNYLAVLKSQDK